MAGRPKAEIDRAVVVKMRSLKFRWQMIADELGVHVKTLAAWRIREQFDGGEDDPLREIDDDELDDIMEEYLEGQGERGDYIIKGHLVGLGIACTRERIRLSVARVDPAAREKRGKHKKKRVVYNVFVPHQLWHMDGWHKLTQRTGVVVHGCIDGASRKAIYVEAADNNSAPTVLNIFKKATVLPDGKLGLPSRVRGDRGGENVLVADLMILARGLGRGSFLVGASWQNQRIEAYWRYINNQCLGYFIELVDTMVKRRIYDPKRDAHKWVFQHLFFFSVSQAPLFAAHQPRTGTVCRGVEQPPYSH